MFANIIPLTKIPINKPQIYTYKITGFEDEIKIGQAVQIPLYNRTAVGIVFSLSDAAEPNITYKTIEKIINPFPIAKKNDLQLAIFTGEYYYASLGLILKHALPALPKRKVKKINEELEKINLAAINNFIEKTTTTIDKNPIRIALGTPTQRQVHYKEIIKNCLKDNRQILFLIPEVMLAPQTIAWLANEFPKEEVIFLHSNMTKTDEIISWRKAQSNAAKIFVGTRKAVFTSFYDLGHIIMDEEQDLSYKQWDMNPRYDAHALAKHKALLYHCQLTFGSSAPSVDAYSRIKNKKYKLIALNKTKTCAAMTIIDMRRELHKKNYSIFSDALLDNLKECLQEKKQAIIFVNRRGLATFVMCRDCGHIERCPNCNIALVEQSGSKLNCNHCSFKSQIPLICPKCRSHRIKGFGTGAERVQQELTKIFPQAKISRADLTNTSNLPLTAEKYHDLLSGNVDVLVGTGIAIRLTSPRLRFLAAVNIDSIMNFPDWRADEKSWQIIKQMSVREDVKHCLIQTYNPDHKLFNAKNFYEQELNNRSTLSYPPFYQMIKLICKSDDFTFLLTESSRVANELRAKIPDIEIIGPIDPINAKIRNFWLKNIMIKFPLNIDFSQKKVIIENIIKNLSNNWSVDVDPLT